MSEEHPVAPEAPTEAAPLVTEAQPVATSEPAPQPTEQGPAEAPAIAAEPVAEPPAEPPALKPHTDEPGILQVTPEAATDKPAEGETAAPEPAAEPVVYEFAVPEGYTVPPERLDQLQTVMREANVAPEHAGKLWAMHTEAMAELRAQELQGQHDAFAEVRRGWRNQIAADPDLGGAGYETNKAAANRMLQLLLSPAHREEMDQFLSTTGATDHPALFRMLVNAAKRLDESQGGPPPSPRPPSEREQQGARPRANGAGNRLFEYDHPRGGGA